MPGWSLITMHRKHLILSACAIVITVMTVGWLSSQPAARTGEVSTNGVIHISAAPFFAQHVAGMLTIEPSVEGEFAVGQSGIDFVPETGLPAGQSLRVRLSPTGWFRFFLLPKTWLVEVRHPQLLFISHPNTQAELAVVDIELEEASILTDSNGMVRDFAVNPNGESVIASLMNAEGGADLWLLSRPEWDAELLVRCDSDVCDQIAWSPDGVWAAYTRQSASNENVWTLRLADQQTAPITQNGTGSYPAWSYDAKYFSFFDSKRNEIVVIDSVTNQWQVISTSIPQKPTWSPDSHTLLVLRSFEGEGQPYTKVVEVNIDSKTSDFVLDYDLNSADYGLPAWHPEGSIIAIPRRLITNIVSRQVIVTSFDGSDELELTAASAYTYARLAWDSTGDCLAFQRFAVGVSGAEPEIGILKYPTGEEVIVIPDAAFPAWLP